MSTPLFEERLAVRRPNALLFALALTPWALAAACGVVWAFGEAPELAQVPFLLAVAGFVAVRAVLGGLPMASVEEETVRVDAAAIVLGDTRIPRERVTRAVYLPTHRTGRDVVRVEQRFGLVREVVTNGRSEAEHLLTAMGHGVHQRVVTFRGASRLATGVARYVVWPLLLVLAVGVIFVAPPLVASAFLLAVVVPSLLLQTMPTAVDVGADGLLVRWVGTRRFIPAAQIAYTERYTTSFGRYLRHGLRVYVSEAEPVEILCGTEPLGEEEVGTVDARIQWMLALPRGGDLQAARAALAREGRPIAAWLSDLRAIGSGGAASFRQAPPSRERLLEVLEAADVTPAERAAAAVALSAAPDAPRERVRVVVDATADPAVRATIEAAARGDDVALARALEALEARSSSG